MLTKEQILEHLKKVKDPELLIDIVTLGLVYEIKFGEKLPNSETPEYIEVLMTLTTPFCPYAEEIILNVEEAINELQSGEGRVEITFDPPWEPSKELKERLGIF